MKNKKFFCCKKVNDEHVLVWCPYRHSFNLFNLLYSRTLQVDIKDFSIITIKDKTYLLTLTDYSLTLYQSIENSGLNTIFQLTPKNNRVQDYFVFVKLGNSICKINDLDIIEIEASQCLDELKEFKKDSGVVIREQRIFKEELYTVTLPTYKYIKDFAGVKLLNNPLGFYNSNFENDL